MAPWARDDEALPGLGGLSPDDVVCSTLAAVDERELSSALRAGLRVFSPGFMTRDIRMHVPPAQRPTLRRPNGRRPHTFPELVSAVRHQWAAVELAPASVHGVDGAGTNRAGG